MPQESPGRGDRLAEYVRPTVYAPPAQAVPRRPASSLARVVRAAVGTAAFLGGLPALLVLLGGNPVQRLPSGSQLAAWFDQPSGRFTPTVLAGAVIWSLWLLWAALALLLVAELLALATRSRIRVLRLPAPLHRLVFGLAGTAAIAVTSAGNLTPIDGAGTSPAAVASVGAAQAVPRQAVARGPALIQIADTRYLYTVERHDTLSKVAKEWLGDAGRWPEICRLNKHRHFPGVGGTLRDCDLIYPGWELRLPADARPPRAATPAPAPPPTTVTPSPHTAPHGPSPTASPTPADHGSAATPESPPPATPSTRVPTPTTGADPVPTTTASPSTVPPASGTHRPPGADDEQGVQLSAGSWLPWSLAAAITTAAALVWRQRRRRYTGNPDDDPPTELPPPVVELRRAVAHQPELPPPGPDDTGPPRLQPDPAPLPSGATGIVGDGALSAARAALVAVLACGDPHHPQARGEVVIDTATLHTLLGPDMPAISPWPRLHVTDNLTGALRTIESLLLHRSRIANEQAPTDLDASRPRPSDEQTLPPIMLITEAPGTDDSARTQATLAAGEGLHVAALLLGEWPHGVTLEVAPDGHTTHRRGRAPSPAPSRLAVLEPAAAHQILITLKEAHTGEPPATASAAPVTVVPLHASRTATTPDKKPAPTTSPSADSPTAKAHLRVLGQPRIDNITKPGRPLRAKALELAVFLACHPDGVTTRDIGEYLEPDARISQADQRVHTNASNLRHVLGRAGTAEAKNSYLIKTAGRYRLDPATVDVDVWTLRDLMRRAAIAPEPRRRELLTTACELAAAPLAEGQDYEWLQPHRETVRRWGTEAHLLLADDLLGHDPQAASDLLTKAIELDRYNEALYTKAMHARHALGDADGIRTLLRGLTKALADLDAEPHQDTITVAQQLRASQNEN